MRSLSLAHLTVLEVGPPDLMTLAAEAGFQAAGIRLTAAVPGGAEYPLPLGSAELREARRRMSDSGLDVLDVEMICLDRDTKVDDYRGLFETAAELGAQRLNVAGDEPDLARMIEIFAGVCDRAAEVGLGVDIEFMPWRPVATLDQAVAVVAGSGRANAGILIDALHLYRSGGNVADLAKVDPRFIRSVQLCDTPLARPPGPGFDAIIAEARGNRLLPGAGELPLLDLLDALPDHVWLGAEIPLAPSVPALSPLERARRVCAATKSLIATWEERRAARQLSRS